MSTLRPGEPGYHDSQYAVDQAREMERDAAWVDHFRFHEATDSEVIASQRARIRALEACMEDLLLYLPCGHETPDRCCCTCEGWRLLDQRVRILSNGSR